MQTVQERNEQRVKDAVEALRAVGKHNAEDETVFAEALGRLHRTEQQNVVRLLHGGMNLHGTQAEGTQAHDARNEATVKYCAELPALCAPYI